MVGLLVARPDGLIALARNGVAHAAGLQPRLRSLLAPLGSAVARIRGCAVRVGVPAIGKHPIAHKLVLVSRTLAVGSSLITVGSRLIEISQRLVGNARR